MPNPPAPVELALYFGSTNGDTARVAARFASLCEELPALPRWTVDLLDVADYFLEEMPTYDLVVLGVPTWNHGQMQSDWAAVFDEFDSLNLSGVPVALLGLGDQRGYPATFADALIFFADKLQERGARLIGRWNPALDPAGYTFDASWALQNGSFVGLVLDEVNQPQHSEPRLRRWLAQLRREYTAWAGAVPPHAR